MSGKTCAKRNSRVGATVRRVRVRGRQIFGLLTRRWSMLTRHQRILPDALGARAKSGTPPSSLLDHCAISCFVPSAAESDDRKEHLMLPWLIGGVLLLTMLVVFVLRDAIADDRRRKLEKAKTNYSRY